MKLQLHLLRLAAFTSVCSLVVPLPVRLHAQPAPPAVQNLVANGDFENGKDRWKHFVPADSKNAGASFDLVETGATPHTGQIAVRLFSSDYARHGISTTGFRVRPGECYRISLQLRAEDDAQVRPGTAGFVIRLTLRKGKGDADGGHYFIRTDGIATRGFSPETVSEATPALPRGWTRIEATVEIPPGVDLLAPALFGWQIKGGILIDNVSITRE